MQTLSGLKIVHCIEDLVYIWQKEGGVLTSKFLFADASPLFTVGRGAGFFWGAELAARACVRACCGFPAMIHTELSARRAECRLGVPLQR
eukprot:3199332-Amphidinium_carterae.1